MNTDSADWQSEMFIRRAAQFDEICRAKGEADSVISFLDSIVPAPMRAWPLLDVGCGPGRLTQALARLFPKVVGLDFSNPFLEIARTRHQSLKNVEFVHGTMRQIRDYFPSATFGTALRSYTSLGYFPKAEELEIASSVLDILRPGGLYIVDSFNADWFEHNKRFQRTVTLPTFDLVEEYDCVDGFAKCRWEYQTGAETVVIDFSLQLYRPNNVQDLLLSAGFDHVSLYGGYQGSSINTHGSPPERLVAVGTRR